MPATRQQRWHVKARAWVPWRRVWGDRTVRRTVQGVPLYMPWSHVLPDYARARSYYGQNLVELAAGLIRHSATPSERLTLLDIGANIGDSTLQVLRRVDGTALCVEGDPYWARYLRQNAGEDARVTIEEVLLTPTDTGWGDVRAVRDLGTTKFELTAEHDAAAPRLSVVALHDRHPEFAELSLIKSDTDGFDPMLIVAAAEAWHDSGPTLFFEFDPGLTRQVSEQDPNQVWRELAELGYSRLAIWDNTGDPLGQLEIGQAEAHARRLEPLPPALGYQFWDVAACRDDDLAAQRTFDELVSKRFDPTGSFAGPV
jgi:FkbM family methyltransferase